MNISYYNQKIEVEFKRIPDDVKTIEQFKIYRHICRNFYRDSVRIKWLSGNKARITDGSGDIMILICKGKKIIAEFDKESN